MSPPETVASSPPPDPEALAVLVRTLLERHGEGVQGVLLYGSCLRSGDLLDGLVDLYLIADDYRHVYASRAKALANWLLPPNVFYIEVPLGEQRLRAKYAVLSAEDLQGGTSDWFHSYLWGRFAQPTALAWTRDPEARARLEGALHAAARTFVERVLPCVPETAPVTELWRQGLRLSYAAELRAEGPERADALVASAPEHYRALTERLAGELGDRLSLEPGSGEPHYRARIPSWRRRAGYLAWGVRRVHGKGLSVLRLVKGLATFEGGLDYLAWKLERHSGQRIEIPERVRRYPLLFVWGLFWRLYRRGVFG